MRPCIITPKDMIYEEVDFGEGKKARLRVLNKIESIEGGQYIQATSKLDEQYKGLVLILKNSLTDRTGKSFEDGGAGWNLSDENGKKYEVTFDNLSWLDSTFFDKLQAAYLTLQTRINTLYSDVSKN